MTREFGVELFLPKSLMVRSLFSSLPLASGELYGELLEAGVQVCEYQPSMMHAKLALIDDDWVSTGSANFDPRSLINLTA